MIELRMTFFILACLCLTNLLSSHAQSKHEKANDFYILFLGSLPDYISEHEEINYLNHHLLSLAKLRQSMPLMSMMLKKSQKKSLLKYTLNFIKVSAFGSDHENIVQQAHKCAQMSPEGFIMAVKMLSAIPQSELSITSQHWIKNSQKWVEVYHKILEEPVQ
ncbi:MAG: hypothetical protein H6845_02240 [Alphaproteobacteria bacterium]|nr:MAG: hypothetical protein H6845_02240 [Alphaproteobacteria bacterium]